MSRAGSFVSDVPWSELQDAFGPATEIPALLQKVATVRGKRLEKAIGDLCEHVLHQGTIYSASPAVVRALIDLAKEAGPLERTVFYDVLSEFASSARQAIAAGRAIPCCSGGDPVDGEAIRDAILGANPQFVADLAHPDAGIRRFAGELATAFAETPAATASMVRERYFVEAHPEVRGSLLTAMFRVRASFDDWSGFLQAALEQDQHPANRFRLRHAQIVEAGPHASPEAVRELVTTFAESQVSRGMFFEAVSHLGPPREVAGLIQSLELASEQSVTLAICERLLRAAFQDTRTGWGEISFSMLPPDGQEPQPSGSPSADLIKMALRMAGLAAMAKVSPSMTRQFLARQGAKGIRKIDYWDVKGSAPEMPAVFTSQQQAVLTACARKTGLWEFRTNLWELFGLPASAAELEQLVAQRS
jgi:hypothetical protein